METQAERLRRTTRNRGVIVVATFIVGTMALIASRRDASPPAPPQTPIALESTTADPTVLLMPVPILNAYMAAAATDGSAMVEFPPGLNPVPSAFTISCGQGSIRIALTDGTVTYDRCTPDAGAAAFWRAVQQMGAARLCGEKQ